LSPSFPALIRSSKARKKVPVVGRIVIVLELEVAFEYTSMVTSDRVKNLNKEWSGCELLAVQERRTALAASATAGAGIDLSNIPSFFQ
jgi:hypothetical protein